jgi:hypothetical protein
LNSALIKAASPATGGAARPLWRRKTGAARVLT